MSKNTTESDPSEYYSDDSVNQVVNRDAPPRRDGELLDETSNNINEQFVRHGVARGPTMNGGETLIIAGALYGNLLRKCNYFEVEHEINRYNIQKLQRELTETKQEKELLEIEIKNMKAEKKGVETRSQKRKREIGEASGPSGARSPHAWAVRTFPEQMGK